MKALILMAIAGTTGYCIYRWAKTPSTPTHIPENDGLGNPWQESPGLSVGSDFGFPVDVFSPIRIAQTKAQVAAGKASTVNPSSSYGVSGSWEEVSPFSEKIGVGGYGNDVMGDIDHINSEMAVTRRGETYLPASDTDGFLQGGI